MGVRANASPSSYPQVAIYLREGALRRTIDCIPTTEPEPERCFEISARRDDCVNGGTREDTE